MEEPWVHGENHETRRKSLTFVWYKDVSVNLDTNGEWTHDLSGELAHNYSGERTHKLSVKWTHHWSGEQTHFLSGDRH